MINQDKMEMPNKSLFAKWMNKVTYVVFPWSVFEDIGSRRSKMCVWLGSLHKVSHENSPDVEPFPEKSTCFFISSTRSKERTSFSVGTKCPLSRHWSAAGSGPGLQPVITQQMVWLRDDTSHEFKGKAVANGKVLPKHPVFLEPREEMTIFKKMRKEDWNSVQCLSQQCQGYSL